MGNTTVNGRVYRYYTSDGEVVFAVMFDTRDGALYINSGGVARNGAAVEEVEDHFGTFGCRFAVRYHHAGPVVIDGQAGASGPLGARR